VFASIHEIFIVVVVFLGICTFNYLFIELSHQFHYDGHTHTHTLNPSLFNIPSIGRVTKKMLISNFSLLLARMKLSRKKFREKLSFYIKLLQLNAGSLMALEVWLDLFAGGMHFCAN
jgi:hypothetical protein